MLRELQKKMEELHMVSPGEKIIAGVSGGADSVCLLVALRELQKSLQFSLEVIHVEHGIRGEESKEDASFVVDLCKALDVDCKVYAVDVPTFAAEHGLGFEEAARILRYDIFEKQALAKGAKIALAHHREDNAETVLFQMVRGSSLTGLCGMQPIRQDAKGVCYIRPLLSFHRDEIETFLESCNVSWKVDSTNVDLTYSRNFLRGKVIPELKEMNSQAVEHINQTAEHLSEIQDYIELEAEKWWNVLVNEDEGLTLDVKGLLELHPVMQRQIAYKAIVFMAGRKKDITSVHVADLLSLCRSQSGKQISLPYRVVAKKEFASVRLQIGSDELLEEIVWEVPQNLLTNLLETEKEEILIIGDNGEQISCRVWKKEGESVEIPRKTYTKWFDYDKIKQGFCIRTRRSGDYFISDTEGHRKKLKSYFVDEKIPLSQRGRQWLLAQENVVLWLIGKRISEHVKVSQETNYILEVTYNGGKTDE